MLTELSVTEFLDRTASGNPVPGGGSSAALSGALAAALMEMVARLTLGRKGFESVQDQMAGVAEQAAALRSRLTLAVDRDATAYSQVLAAYRLPKTTETESVARKQAIQAAFYQAALTPLDVARDALATMHLGRTVLLSGNPNAASDAAAGVLAARTALRAAVYNIRINLTALEDEALSGELKRQADELEATCESTEAALLALVRL